MLIYCIEFQKNSHPFTGMVIYVGWVKRQRTHQNSFIRIMRGAPSPSVISLHFLSKYFIVKSENAQYTVELNAFGGLSSEVRGM